MVPPTLEGMGKLWTLCEDFIKENEITCPETISQTDRVIENAYEFIDEICKILGYVKLDE